MGYLDNTSITVDAVLTKKGREILKDGGNLNISSFTLSDTGVDYTLWNTDHPSGSAFYGEAIENLPQLEASVHAEYNMRNRLISLSQNSIAIPALVIDSGMDVANGRTKTFNQGEEASGAIQLRLVGYSSNTNQGMTMIIQKPNIVTPGTEATLNSGLSGTTMIRQFISSEEIPQAQAYDLTSVVEGTDRITSVSLTPVQQDTAGQQTNVIFIDNEVGTVVICNIINNITSPNNQILSDGGVGAF